MQLKRRAGADFDCPGEQIKTQTLDDRTKVATGCGQAGTYIYICHKCPDIGASIALGIPISESCECTWSLDSARRTAERPPSPAPSPPPVPSSPEY